MSDQPAGEVSLFEATRMLHDGRGVLVRAERWEEVQRERDRQRARADAAVAALREIAQSPYNVAGDSDSILDHCLSTAAAILAAEGSAEQGEAGA